MEIILLMGMLLILSIITCSIVFSFIKISFKVVFKTIIYLMVLLGVVFMCYNINKQKESEVEVNERNIGLYTKQYC